MNTPQETFDITLFGLRKQGKASMGPDGEGHAVCKYRGEDNCKCAAGFHIPDEVYSQKVEGEGIGTLGSKYFTAVPLGQLWLLSKMQTAHDKQLASKSPKALSLWERKMSSIAKYHHLNYTEPK